MKDIIMLNMRNKKRNFSVIELIAVKTFSIFLFSLSLIFTASAKDLPSRISFQHLLKNKDIVLGEVSTIYQDSQGFMWFGGANGLMRFDGYDFKQFFLEGTGDQAGEKIASKSHFDIIEDRDGYIWIATRTGLLKFDPKLEKLIKIANDPEQTVQIGSTDMLQVMELPSGELIVSSKNGLFVVDRTTNRYEVVLPDENNPNSIHHKKVQASHIDASGQLWIGTEAGLEKVDWNTKTFELIKPYPENVDLIPANSVTAIVSDSDGTLWLGTFNGLVNYNPLTKKSIRYVHDPKDRFSLGGNDIWHLLFDSYGYLWITSDGGGLTVFNRYTKKFNSHRYEAGRETSISSNQVRTVFEDKSGDLWVGNYPDGINYFDRSSAAITSYARDPSNKNSLSHSSVLSLKEDGKGNLWLGTDGGGLNYFDRENESFTHYIKDENDPSTISSNAVLTTFMDNKGHIWVGTWAGGMSTLNPQTGKFTRHPFDEQRAFTSAISTSDKLNSAHVWSIKEDSRGDLWIATHTGGLSKYDRKTKQYTHYTPKDGDNSSISVDLIWDTFEDSKGRFWVGTSAGLDLMDRDSGTFKHFDVDPNDPNALSNPSVLSLFEDSKNRLWFGTDSGLNLLNPDEKSFTVYGKKDGFNNDTIRQIIEGPNGVLWISTNNGVSSFDPQSKKIKNYNRESGTLVGGFHTDSGLMSQKGEIIFGGINGFRIYRPLELVENASIPPVVFTDFKVFADSIKVGAEDGLLSQAINHTDSITLDYKKSMFVFGFSALNFRDSNKNQYSYKLEGFDDNWLNVGNQRQAKYTNLNAGTYVFKVRASNNDGVWNEEGASLTIIQTPPPWLTWWAYSLYALTIIGIIVWFIHHQKQKRRIIEKQNRLLEAKVAERTAELRQKNHDIQAMLENMPQGLFTIQDDQCIHPEYSHYLEEIFETKELAGHNVNEILFTGAAIGTDALDSNKNAIFSIVGEDVMGYEFNKSLLIDEYDIDINGKTKHLSLDWNPIIVDDLVNKLMVSVRDVTKLRLAENEALEQKRELDIIQQLLNLSAEKYLAFEESAKRYLQINRDTIETNEDKNEEILSLLFRNMHTIKGNCRTYGFTFLSDVVHEVESTYTALKKSDDSHWNTDELLDDLDRVEKCASEYADVYRRVLGRGESENTDRHDGFWMSNKIMNKIEALSESSDMEGMKQFISRMQSLTLDEVLIDVISSLSSIASQLGKRTPNVKIDADTIRIKKTGVELLHDVFAHILRNCVDHGLELPEQRIDANKDERGTIRINAMVIEGKLQLYINDDGQGINLDALFKRGVELNRWSKEDRPSNYEIAELMFSSGVSTKEVVTDISGRGVGMDAVKQFLTAQGGDVNLILQNTQQSNKGFVPFELLITLPEKVFIKTEKEPESDATIQIVQNHLKSVK